MDFFLFALVNVALFLRPQDLASSLAGISFYNWLIVANLAVSAPAIANLLSRGAHRVPAIVCVGGVFVALLASLLVRGDVAAAWEGGREFLKVIAYFLLLIAVLRTPRRLAFYLAWLVTLTLTVAGLSVAHFHGLLDLAAITHAKEALEDAATGSRVEFYRLTAYGVFSDPNDLSMMVVLSILICLGGLAYRRLGVLRFLLAVPLLFLGYSLALTQSRGGLLALMAGLAAFLTNRYGMKRSSVALAVLLPLLLVLFGGRQADIGGGISRGTGSARTDLWYAGLQMLKWHPLQGVGHGHFVEEAGQVAHNSYLHALAEWGIFGGTMFIGLFYVVLHSVWRLKQIRYQIAAPVLRNFQPYVAGALAAYAMSMMTLTRCDVVPTYLVAGLGVSFERLAVRNTDLRPLKLTPALLGRMLAITFGFLALLYVYIRFLYRMF